MTAMLSCTVKAIPLILTELEVAGRLNRSIIGADRSGAALVVKIKSEEVERLCELSLEPI